MNNRSGTPSQTTASKHVSHMTRRTFLKMGLGAAGVTTTAAAASALAGCGGVGVSSGPADQTDSSNESSQAGLTYGRDTTGKAMPEGDIALPSHADHGTTGGDASGDVPKVYFSREVSPQALAAVYAALGTTVTGNVGVKVTSGEGNSNYLRADLVGDFIRSVGSTIVECNTAYGGQRGTNESHYRLARDHGWFDIEDFQIMDENGSMSLPVEGGTRLTENLVGAHFADYDGFVVLSHFKGHAMAGFGGALKNVAIGMASREGKCRIHTAGASSNSPWGGDTAPFQECMAEAVKSVVDAVDGNILFVNVANRLSVDCDCDANPAEPEMADIGILASADPVALDQACIDQVYDRGEEGAALVRRIETLNGEHILEHAADIGLGSREYQLVEME